MKTIKYLIIIIIYVVALGSCRKIVQLPPVPHVEFTSFAVIDSISPLGNHDKAGILKFYFEDGDGNLGLQNPEAQSADTVKNLYFKSYKKIAGIMVQITDTTDPVKAYNYRIPYMERTGQNKILKGTISVTFLYTFYEPKDSNIIRYDFFIKDRTDNVSETVSTCEIPISINGLYKN